MITETLDMFMSKELKGLYVDLSVFNSIVKHPDFERLVLEEKEEGEEQ